MRRLFFFVLLLIACRPELSAQGPDIDLLNQASDLNDKSQFQAAIDLLAPLVRSDAQDRDRASQGDALNLTGIAYQNLGNAEQARRSYEKAVEVLRRFPDHRKQYASALDNLGSIDLDNGQIQESESVRLRAKLVYAQAGDHAGIARVANNLALAESNLRKNRKARQYLAEALREQALVPAPSAGDVAAVYSVEALLNAREGKFAAALSSIDHAIELWTEHYGGNYYLLAAGLSMRGQINGQRGDLSSAKQDFDRSFAILKHDSESDPYVYLTTRVAYAKVLRDAGQSADAARIEAEAKASLEDLRGRRCAQCSVSVAAFR